MATGIGFAGNSIQNPAGGITVVNVRHYGGPTKNQKIFPMANADRSSVSGDPNRPDKVIVVTGQLKASSIALLDALIDTFKGYFIDGEQNLDLDYNGGTRRYIAVAGEPDIQRDKGMTVADFTIIFTCTQPYGQNTTSTSALSQNGRTSHSYTDNHTFVGNAHLQLPVVTIVINSVTDGDGLLSFKNNTTGQGITVIGQTFEAADTLVIDCKNRSVKLNGVEVDYLGAFPGFPKGSQPMKYEDSFTAVNFDIDVDYYPLWK